MKRKKIRVCDLEKCQRCFGTSRQSSISLMIFGKKKKTTLDDLLQVLRAKGDLHQNSTKESIQKLNRLDWGSFMKQLKKLGPKWKFGSYSTICIMKIKIFFFFFSPQTEPVTKTQFQITKWSLQIQFCMCVKPWWALNGIGQVSRIQSSGGKKVEF